MKNTSIAFLLLIIFSGTIFAQQNNYRPELFFREDWKESPAEIPLSQKHVNNDELLVNLYGAGKDSLDRKSVV